MNKVGLILLFRFILAIAFCPLITSLLVVAPTYIYDSIHLYLEFYLLMVLLFSYGISLFFGLPIAVYLFVKNKCSFTALAISGFILGFLTSICITGISITMFLEITNHAIWWGSSAATGAALFGYITGISTWLSINPEPQQK